MFLFVFKAVMFMAFILSVAETTDTVNTPLNEMLVYGRLVILLTSLPSWAKR